MMFRFTPFALLLAFSSVEAKEPVMLLKGKLLAEATLDSAEQSASWETIGEVKFEGGALHWASEKGVAKAGVGAAFLKADGVSLGDHILEYTFTYHGDFYRNQIVYNDPLGHAIIIELRPDGHHIRKWPDHDQLLRFEEFPDAAGSSLKPARSYTVMIEMRGEEMLVRANEENFLLGKNHRVGRDMHKLVVNFEGGHGTLNSVKLWQASPNPTWEEQRGDWITRQMQRPSRKLTTQPEFEVKLRVAKLRRELRDNEDPKYAELIKEMTAFLEDLRSRYPFYGAKPTRKNVAAHKDARQNDEKFKALMKQLKTLQQTEFAYFQKLDPALAELAGDAQISR
ncbi:MAG: hypothetical protein GY904_23030 [Planctomycetaceae bacterium]|nr:hypothetical protein [Planctomycetaceae bacterium]